MTSTTLALIIVGMGIVTYAIRWAPIALLGRIAIRPVVQRALRFVPPAVLSAIIFPEILRPGDALDFSPLNPRLLAGILAALVAWRTRNAFLAIAVGMLAFWGVQAIAR
jgi:branched-subunit amino acid transport protein